MANDFLEASLEWSRKKEAFVNDKLQASGLAAPRKKSIAERQKVTYSVPKKYKEEIDALIESFRQKADDSNHNNDIANIELMQLTKSLSLEFEGKFPAPHSKDF